MHVAVVHGAASVAEDSMTGLDASYRRSRGSKCTGEEVTLCAALDGEEMGRVLAACSTHGNRMQTRTKQTAEQRFHGMDMESWAVLRIIESPSDSNDFT